MMGIASNRRIKIIAVAPMVFFIMMEEPTTVPATDCTTEPAPGIIPTIRLNTAFFVASKEGTTMVSSR